MRRIIILVTIATTAFGGVALAGSPRNGTFKAGQGQVQRGYDLKFTVKGNKIKNLVAHVLETCAGSSTSSTTTVGPGLTWAIRGGKFSGRKKETSGGVTLYTTLKGRFTSPSTAKGIIRQESIVAGSTCDTYELKFTAKR